MGRTGQKRKEYSEQFLQSVPLHQRTTVRSFAGALKISTAAVFRLKKQGKLRSHTSNNHPRVTHSHKLQRMQWVLSQIIPRTPNAAPTFNNMSNVIHSDEKWFYLNPETRRFYLLPKEDDPYRCEPSKKYKMKVMFMSLISRPIYDNEGTLVHDGKYGIFPFVYYQRAARSSKNRAAGTIETKANQNVNRHSIREMLLQNVIPAIKEKWPAERMGKDVWIQWDNARPHIIPTDDEWIAATQEDGWDIKMVFQPPQSPDLNVLDLGLFRTIQSIQYQSFPKTLDDLIDGVKEAYNEFDPIVNKYTWLTLQTCMVEILKNEGGNNYKIPHMGKRRLDEQGQLPNNIEVPDEVIANAVNHLNERLRPTGQVQREDPAEVDAD